MISTISSGYIRGGANANKDWWKRIPQPSAMKFTSDLSPPFEGHDDDRQVTHTPDLDALTFSPGPAKMDRGQAKALGFTGNTCVQCGSMAMVRNGTCEKCNDCGSTTGCS